MLVRRKLLWLRYTESTDPQLFGWNFLVINEPRDIRQIREKLITALDNINDQVDIDDGRVKCDGNGLYYDLFTLVSPTPRIDFSNVYQGTARRDRRLQPRQSPEGWHHFINQVASGKV